MSVSASVPSAYDIAVAYRVYPGLSKSGFPGVRDKEALVSGCLRSFKEAVGDLRVKIYAILDGCPESYERIFRKTFAETDLEIIALEKSGNARTFLKQVALLCTQTDADIVYCAEDDYVYMPGALPRMVEFLRTLPDRSFVSAYDHPDAYAFPVSMSNGSMRVHAGHHWRSVVSTCLTFMTRRQTLQLVEPLLRTYGRRNDDSSIWQSMTKSNAIRALVAPRTLFHDRQSFKVIAKAWWFGWRQILLGARYTLWVPVPSFATHLEPRRLAPGIDWQPAFDRLNVPGLVVPDDHPHSLTGA